MKELKDIGHPCNLLCARGWLYTPGFVSEVKEISHKFFCDHETQENVPAIAYSLEERREFARRIWGACKEASYNPHPDDLEDFLKSEGL